MEHPPSVEWRVDHLPVDYEHAVRTMERDVADIVSGDRSETVWLLEHPALYSAGTSARPGDLLDGRKLPVFRSGRGGEYTYHGPGQRIAYVMLDLSRRGCDVRGHVRNLERWIIAALGEFGVTGELRPGRVGIWVAPTAQAPDKDLKIAAIGVRVRRWVSYHGVSINVAPDLSHYDGIVPCGITGHGVTSLAELGVTPSIREVDEALKRTFGQVFGVTSTEPAAV